MNGIDAFSQNATTSLLESIDTNLSQYKKSRTWALSFLGKDSNAVLATRLAFNRTPHLVLPEKNNKHDFDNSVRLHKAMPPLSPLQARDPRLWTYLAHVTFWEYMRARWPIPENADRKKAAMYVREHYFVAEQASRSLTRHGIARLWWYAHLTYDDRRKNPYELTAVLLKTLDITQTVLERSFGRNRMLRLEFLQYLLDHKDVFLQSGDKSRLAVRELAKALNLHGGSCLLDALSPRDLRRFFDEQRARFQSANAVE